MPETVFPEPPTQLLEPDTSLAPLLQPVVGTDEGTDEEAGAAGGEAGLSKRLPIFDVKC